LNNRKLAYKKNKNKIPVPQIKPLSTVGAGDSFNAGFVYALLKNEVMLKDISGLSEQTWTKMVETAIQFSSEVCLRYENFVSTDFANTLR
jgi:fructokinase